VIELGGEAIARRLEGEFGQGPAGALAPVDHDPLGAALGPAPALAVVEALSGREQARVEAQHDPVAEVLVAADDDVRSGAVLRHVAESGLEAAAPALEEARGVHAVSGEEDGEPDQGGGAPPAAGAQRLGEELPEQDQEERDSDQEVAQVDDLGARRPEDRGRRQRDRDQVEEPQVVALAPETDQRERGQPERERGMGRSELRAHREAQGVADRARGNLARHGRRAAADAQMAQVDAVEQEQHERRSGVQAQGVGEPRTGSPPEALRRERQGAGPEEGEDELREQAEAGRRGEQRGPRRAPAFEEAQQREQRHQREADGQRVAARLRGVVDQGEARGAEPRGEDRLELPAARGERGRQRDGRRSGDERRQPVDRPAALVAERVEEQRVQVVVVRVVELREDAEGRAEPHRVVPGPDLVEPEVAAERERAQQRPGRHAGRDGEPGPTRSGGGEPAHCRLPQISTRGAFSVVR
jgi:hypothetical protein